MMGYYRDGSNWVAFAIMMAVMFLFMAGIIAVIVYAIRGFSRNEWSGPPRGPAEDRALALLRERYARGEIDHDEYEERQRRLMNPPRA
ncbi:MAG: SHOCT domain-containing protein [Thermomicrobiales bacterium]